MQLTLKNGSSVTIGFDEKGSVKSASKMLGQTPADGYATVRFLTPTLAQEISVSPTNGFLSICTYEKDQLLREVCTDNWHKKAFYYTYENGTISETQIRSLGTADKEQKARRASITHTPVRLLEELKKEPATILFGKDRWDPATYAVTARSRAA